jgi:hypothetical protein
MAKKYLIPAVFIFLSLYSVAQHCQWDGSSFIMLDINGNPSVKVQKIYLLDSTGAIVLSKHYFGNSVKTDIAEFWKNPPKDAMLNPSKYRKQYFSFAKDYYVLEFGQYNPAMPYRILIQYSSGHKTLRKVIPVSKQGVHVLCTLNKNLWSGKEKPIAVIL